MTGLRVAEPAPPGPACALTSRDAAVPTAETDLDHRHAEMVLEAGVSLPPPTSFALRPSRELLGRRTAIRHGRRARTDIVIGAGGSWSSYATSA